jgi:hypothetical protein
MFGMLVWIWAMKASAGRVKIIAPTISSPSGLFRLSQRLMPSGMKRLRQLEDENAELKRIVADLSLDEAMLQEVLSRKLWGLRANANSRTGFGVSGRSRRRVPARRCGSIDRFTPASRSGARRPS